MSKYAGLIKNDFTNGEGVCVSLFMQGCPHHCKGCFNSETWDFNGGKEITESLEQEIIEAIFIDGIQRNFSILGGEPLCPENREFVNKIIYKVKTVYPNIKIYVWTGYVLNRLIQENNHYIQNILKNIDVLIDGPFIEDKKDLTLKLRGSTNQKILYKGIDF